MTPRFEAASATDLEGICAIHAASDLPTEDVDQHLAHFILAKMKQPEQTTPSAHKPRILFLYGSLRTRSYSRLLAEEAARIISDLGAEVRCDAPHERQAL